MQQLIDDSKNFYKNLDLVGLTPIPIKIVLFNYSEDYDIFKIFENYKHKGFENVSLPKISENERFVVYELKSEPNKVLECPHCKRRIKTVSSKAKTLLLFSKSYPVIIMISNKRGNFFERVDLRFMNKYYPFVSRFFFRSRELKEIIDNISLKLNKDITFSSCVLKRYYEQFKNPEVLVQYFQKSYNYAFDFARGSNLWVHNILLNLPKMDLRLSRTGVFGISMSDFDFSDFENIYSLILEYPINKFVELYNSLLKDNSLSCGDTKIIEIKLRDEFFDSQEDIDNFINFIGKQFIFSVVHRYDNFVKMICSDFKSGGSFDLLIDAKDKIKILPQFQVTSTLLNKVIGYILNEYEGEINGG